MNACVLPNFSAIVLRYKTLFSEKLHALDDSPFSTLEVAD